PAPTGATRSGLILPGGSRMSDFLYLAATSGSGRPRQPPPLPRASACGRRGWSCINASRSSRMVSRFGVVAGPIGHRAVPLLSSANSGCGRSGSDLEQLDIVADTFEHSTADALSVDTHASDLLLHGSGDEELIPGR